MRNQSMWDSGEPIDIRSHWPALRVRNRNERHLRIGLMERKDIGRIESAVQCYETFMGKFMEQRSRPSIIRPAKAARQVRFGDVCRSWQRPISTDCAPSPVKS